MCLASKVASLPMTTWVGVAVLPPTEDQGNKGKLRDGSQSTDVCTEWNFLLESDDTVNSTLRDRDKTSGLGEI